MRVRTTAAAVILLACAAADAQTIGPGYYRVAHVAEDSRLNVRSEPRLGSRVVAALAPGAAPVDVVEVRDAGEIRWGRIAAREGSGWIAMRYVEPADPERLLDTPVPADARCSGTEPFWGLTFEDETAVLEQPAGDEPHVTRLAIDSAAPASGRIDPVLLSFGEDRGHAVLERGVCSDGMSDIPHGWSVQLILESGEPGSEPRLLSGCCRVASPAR